MCGRFTLTVNPDELQEKIPWLNVPADAPLAPRYNIAPSQSIPVVTNTGKHELELFRWGLIPSWAKDPAVGNRLINARAETLSEKPAFRAAFKRRRCLILADGFYEWRKEPDSKTKTPMYIRLKSDEPFAFAGLWEVWRSPEEETVLSATIITGEPNSLVAKIHDRMPVILKPDAYERWLDPAEQAPQALAGLLKPYPATQMKAYPVSKLVNKPGVDSPECIAPWK
ncbi:MAG TPA: SOS response-associated peptidase [Anaerolineae bacterium]|nr:SOS response-associated peptidase [Anaerolineae bacterium]